MTTDFTQLSLAEIVAELESVSQDVKTKFGGLNAEQINWKPGADQWSVGQCLDHLITSNTKFFPVWERVLSGQQEKTFWQKMPFIPNFLGKMMVSSLGPVVKQKFKAPAVFQPSSSVIDPAIVSRFIEHQNEVIARMKQTEGQDLDRIIISSPATNAIVYSLLNAFRIVAAHERRHQAQAERVIETPRFPN